jgi:TolB protein
MWNYIFFLCLAFQAIASAHSSFKIELETNHSLEPITLTLIEESPSQETFLNRSYKEALFDTLLFDLNLNGGSTVVEKNMQASQNLELIFAEDTVKLASQTFKTNALRLTGNLERDRRQMHLLADTFTENKYNLTGIAGSHILFTKRVENSTTLQTASELWECDYDGKNARRLYVFDNYCLTPTYVPPERGEKRCRNFFFVGYKTGQPKIYLAPLHQGKVERLSYLPGNQLMPVTNREGNQLAFICDAAGNPDIFSLNFDKKSGVALGKPYQIFTKHYATQGTPSFSPNGKQIAFVSNKEGSPQIYLLTIPEPGSRVKDIAVKRLTRYQRECTAPNWSFDGSKIAYCANTEGVRQIFIYNLIKGEEEQVTFGAGDKENPSFSPNDQILVYNKIDQDISDLFILNLKNKANTKITSGYGENRFPNWEPYK